MTSQSKLTPPLKWHGGKYYLAKEIVAMMPPHLAYVEPFFGGGQVLFARDSQRDWFVGGGDQTGKLPPHLSGSSEVINDIHGELMNFWRVLQDDDLLAQFRRRVEATSFSQVEFDEAADYATGSQVERAVKFFIRARQSRQGLMKDFATLTRNRTRGGKHNGGHGINEQASAWLSVVEGLPDVHHRLRGVIILCDDALKLICQQDGDKVLMYLDPPYLHGTRVTTNDYQFEMTDEVHAELISTIKQCKAKVILSGYPNDLYDRELADWNRKDISIDNKASGKRTKDKKTERLWTNF